MGSCSGSQFERVRRPAVAGMFYPARPDELRQMVASFLAQPVSGSGPGAKAWILPHAGYVYSGPVAGTGYSHLKEEEGEVKRVILLGPSHRVAFKGIAVSSHDAFATPLGEVPVDRAAIQGLRELPPVVELDVAHAQEHSLEVHLPFLQLALGEFTLVPLVVGEAGPTEVGEVLERLWGGDETRVIVSSDLSHYHDYVTAQRLDRQTADRLQALQFVTPDQACGAFPICGLMRLARDSGLQTGTLDLRNSGDTAGPRDRVVGYGAFALS